ncbi:MAG: GH39 family glycosyl hydrolase, partial [Thermoanaerobaculia bacterium]
MQALTAIKTIDASIRVGGPATAKIEWLEEFVNFCEHRKVPFDFLSTHYYP